MTIIDTPGLDPNPESREWKIAEGILRNDHPQLLIIDECGNKESFAPTIADHLQTPLEESITASLYFFWSLAEMNSHADLSRLFTVRAGNHFVLTLPSSGTYGDGDFSKRILQANARDLFAISQLDHRPPAGVGIGFVALKESINKLALRYYQEKVIPSLREALSTLKLDLVNKADDAAGSIPSNSEELLTKTHVSYFRDVTAQYCTRVVQTILEFFAGSIRADPAVNGTTLAEELEEQQWLDSFNQHITITSDIALGKESLYGGPQMERLFSQFECVLKSVRFSFGTEVFPRPEDLSLCVSETIKQILDKTALPLSRQLASKATAILKNLFQISVRIADREFKSPTPPPVLLNARLREVYTLFLERLRLLFEEQAETEFFGSEYLMYDFNSNFTTVSTEPQQIGQEYLEVVLNRLVAGLTLKAHAIFFTLLTSDLRKDIHSEITSLTEAELLAIWQPNRIKQQVEQNMLSAQQRLSAAREEERNLLQTVASFN